MSKYWSDLVQKIEPYIPGEQPKDRKYIKLNTNENPYPPSPGVLKVVQKEAGEALRLYPLPNFDDLRQTAAEFYGLKKEQVFAGNGSDEVLAFAFMAFFNPGRPIFMPDITYSFYEVYASVFHIDYRLVPLDEEFNICPEQYCTENGGIIFANPNAPTSKLLPLEAVRRILDWNTDHVVIVDEAYIDFGGTSAIRLIEEYPNLLVVHTMSKYRSLAGLRIGLAFGQEELIQGLDRIKNSINSYTINRISMAAAVQAIRDDDYYKAVRDRIVATREAAAGELRKMGFQVLDSSTNFLFVSHPCHAAADLFRALRDRGILVRYFNKPRIDNYLRITIGTEEETQVLLNAMREIVK